MTTGLLAAQPPHGFWSEAPIQGAVWERGQAHRYSQVWARGDALVEAAGLPARSLAFLFVDNSVESISAYLGFLRAGHVVLLGDHRLPLEFRKGLVDRYRPGVVWSAPGEPSTLLRTAAAVPPALHPDLALLLSTSGTTGSPKLVRLSYSALQSNAAAICRALGIGEGETAITSLQMSYAYGLSIINSHLFAGASLVCTNQGVQETTFWDDVARHECTSFAGVPFQYAILREMDYWAAPQPSIRTYTQAGGGLSAAAQRSHLDGAEAADARLVVMYGQTEATARMSYVPPERLRDHLGTIGCAIPGGKLTIADPDPVSGEGELVYEGPNVMLGYADGRDSLALGDECRGRLRTGDIARHDGNGFFRIVGRRSRIVKPFGVRISLDHLEQCVAEDLGVAAAAVGDDTSIAVFAPTGSEQRATLTARLVARTRLPAHCFRVVEVESLPMTPSGKPDYERLREIAERDGATHPVPSDQGRAADVAQLCQVWSRVLAVAVVAPGTNVFLDLGADSLNAVTFLAELESRFGVRWTLADLLRNPTVDAQADAITDRSARELPRSSPASPFRQLSTASSPDILFFATPSGHESAYLHLAKLMPPSRGFHVMRDWRLDAGKFVPQSVQELADRYVELLLLLPETPAVLGGWCFGGLLAFEVALRLEAVGRAPKALVLIDPIIRRPKVSWVRDQAVRVAWRNARSGNPLSFIPWLRPFVAPNDVGWRLVLSVLNVHADYERLPIGPMADFVLGNHHGIDPTMSVTAGFGQLYAAAYARGDPRLWERFLVPGVNAETALRHLLVSIGNRLATKGPPSGRTRIPTLFITPSQSPNHLDWRRYAIGELEPVCVEGVASRTTDSTAYAASLPPRVVSLYAPHDFSAHANLMQPEAVSLYAPELMGWLEPRLARATPP